MLIDTSGKGRWSDRALWWLIVSTVLAALFSIAHAMLQIPGYAALAKDEFLGVALVLSSDLRYLFEQLIYVSAIIFVGAKFFETRTTFAVTFDRVDSDKVSIRGPDDDNIVWLGHRYTNRAEAEAVAAAFENRLKENAR
jgi:hypothetical protein